MDTFVERAYRKQCFQGRSPFARWLDRTFFSTLGGVCLYLLLGRLVPSLLLLLAILILLILYDVRKWSRYRQKLWRNAANDLRREGWLRQEAERIRKAGGVPLYPMPELDMLTGLCLRLGEGTAFHCFGTPAPELAAAAASMGCTLAFHPWGQGPDPSGAQVIQRLVRDAPKRNGLAWRQLLQLSDNRYLLTGCLLLLLSIFLRRALYWRLLGSLCLLIGAVRRSFRLVTTKQKSP